MTAEDRRKFKEAIADEIPKKNSRINFCKTAGISIGIVFFGEISGGATARTTKV